MPNPRRGSIDRNAIEDDDTPPVTLAQADAALYGKLRSLDGGRRNLDRTRFGAFKITAIGLEISDGAQEKDWREAGEFIFQVEGAIQWLIGDWLVYGTELQYGDIKKLVEEMGRDYQTLRDYMTVSRAIPLSLRNYNLSYNHYRAVTGIENPDHQAIALSYAAENKLSVSAFRQWIKEQTGEAPPLPNLRPLNISNVSRDMEKLWAIDPSTAKKKDHEKARRVAAETRQALEAFERKWGIE